VPRQEPVQDHSPSGAPLHVDPDLSDASPGQASRRTGTLAAEEHGRTSPADTLTSWIDGYLRAWNSNDPDDIAALFTADAEYRTEPYADPIRGRDAIVAFWLANSDEPGRTAFTWTPITVTADVAGVEGTTEYRDDPPKTYSNLWIIRLDGRGRCTSFTEWWMQHPTDA